VAMSRKQAGDQLDQVGKAMREAFGDHHADRLHQLDAALATAGMAVEHLFDEEVRRKDNLARREAAIRAQVEGTA
jgi:hypothetical protein